MSLLAIPHLLHLLALSGAVGTLLPAVVALVNQEPWSSRVKGFVTASLSLLAGLLTSWQQGQMSNWWMAAAVMLVACSGAYKTFWGPTKWADLIETATTLIESKTPQPPKGGK